ncbi:hypothetical protein G7Y89_g263 [Cudoniella acicularis]|uniref:SEC7 domain-containing protein n=1 Tax=Cudoniella acicularis TaxID=354080 RepID=A0A8H4RXH3_9HELO|nr:hypothetical protein G7Y89_g263 [Cudoniella acicularis]
MQSFENTPASPTKRLGVPLNVDTGYRGYKGQRIDISPPRTPAAPHGRDNIATGNRALKETFLDDITPVDPAANKENEPGSVQANRDSHDLSLSPRQITRDSLVDHMLLSLDQFSFGQDGFGTQPTVDEENLYSSFGDEESYQPTSNFAPRSSRLGHTYSYSSDYDNADDSSRYSSQLSRGRRSNSSSNFQSGLGRINSIRNEAGSHSFVGSNRPPIPVPPRGVHSRSGKGSKGSSANSFDLGYAQVTSSQRWAHGLAGRSSSFDYGRDRQVVAAQSDGPSRQNPPLFSPYDYDAAPTPTVPGGPRRPRPTSPIIIPQQEPIQKEPEVQKIERKRSTRSSKSAYKGKGSANASGGRLDYDLNDHTRELPPLPAFIRTAAPAPLVGYGKAKDSLPPSPGLSQPSKERPGFFRRVFGSSRNNPAPVPEPPPSHGSTTSAETANRPSSKPHHIVSQMKSQQTPPTREPPPKEHSHVLTKKPSSFFRRRKNPVSSLRKVMNPYLRTPARSPIEPYPQISIDRQMNNSPEPHNRTTRGFSPDYEPDKSATIRTVKPSSRGTQGSAPSSSGSGQKPYLSSLSAGPTGLDGTFLQDASDNDRDAHSSASKSAPITRDGPVANYLGNQMSPVTPMSATPSVARDMALVAEYERIHSRKSPTEPNFDLTTPEPPLEPPRSPIVSKSIDQKSDTPAADEECVMTTPTKSIKQKEKENRIWLEPSSDEEDAQNSKFALASKDVHAPERDSGSTDTIYKSATSLPLVRVQDEEGGVKRPPLLTAAEAIKSLDEFVSDTNPADEDRERARKIYDGNEDFIQKERAAAWMGEEGAVRSKTLKAYMQLYEFSNLNILAALRIMCSRLVLKAESQQVDRILDEFAKRWCRCNPKHGFKVTDVVHTICYSILLLNTDLHLADIDSKMTRSQFVKNTMPTIRKSVADSAPNAFETRPSVLPGKGQTFGNDSTKQTGDNSLKPEKISIEVERPSWRSSFKPPIRADSEGNMPTPLDYDTPVDDCGPLVKAPFHGTLRTWEVQVEIVLKDFYNSIRNERLPLFGAPLEKPQLQAPSTSSLSVFANGVLRRTPSVLSKAPSETQSNYARVVNVESFCVVKHVEQIFAWEDSNFDVGRFIRLKLAARRLPAIYWFCERFKSSHNPRGDDSSAGSNASDREELRVAPLLEDESLELAGAPWAKEGIVKHKHHLEALDKKAKDRNWNEVFAVVEKGYLSLFSFTSKSMRNKSKGKVVGGVVGGGNWQENAQNLGSFLLRQTIASALPSPGYSKARPHVWALSLPTGAVHLFQVGTPDIVKEFVSTANYWSARLSNHPLVGGISNIEYGWSETIVNNALVTAINESTAPRSSTSGTRPSIQSSLRSSIDQTHTSANIRSRLPGDRIPISDWTPPTQSMRASNLMEADQLQTLTIYVAGIEEELQKHNQLRSPMLLAFTPRHPNSQKAMANWEKKSSYLLREIVKFRTYIDCLQAAEAGKQRIYAEREAEKALAENGDDDEGDTTLRPE